VETYKEVPIFYDKNDGSLYFGFEGVERRAKYLFEAREVIDEPRWETCDLEGYFVDGTFSNYIGKAKATRKDLKSGAPDWKYMGKYDMTYKTPNYDRPKVYPFSRENAAVYAQFKAQNEVVIAEEAKLKSIIRNLKG